MLGRGVVFTGWTEDCRPAVQLQGQHPRPSASPFPGMVGSSLPLETRPWYPTHDGRNPAAVPWLCDGPGALQSLSVGDGGRVTHRSLPWCGACLVWDSRRQGSGGSLCSPQLGRCRTCQRGHHPHTGPCCKTGPTVNTRLCARISSVAWGSRTAPCGRNKGFFFF